MKPGPTLLAMLACIIVGYVIGTTTSLFIGYGFACAFCLAAAIRTRR